MATPCSRSLLPRWSSLSSSRTRKECRFMCSAPQEKGHLYRVTPPHRPPHPLPSQSNWNTWPLLDSAIVRIRTRNLRLRPVAPISSSLRQLSIQPGGIPPPTPTAPLSPSSPLSPLLSPSPEPIRRIRTCHVSAEKEEAEVSEEEASKPVHVNIPEVDMTERLASLGLWVFWAAFFSYALFFAPNQTPTIDQYYLEKLVGLRGDDGFVLNSVCFSLFNMMGLYPLLFTMLLIPASCTERTRVPVWPFATLSMALGAFALLPYFALWTPGPPSIPTQAQRQGFALRIWESKITAVAVLVPAVYLVWTAASAPSIDWLEFGRVVQQSRLFHVTSADFLNLTLSIPFWMYNDMSYRHWGPRSSWGLALLFVPVLGPFTYLVLRPSLPPVVPAAAESK